MECSGMSNVYQSAAPSSPSAPPSSALLAVGDWITAQERVDWQSSGLLPPHQWDGAVKAVIRLMASAPTPMLLMMGPRGILLVNEAARGLLAEPAQVLNGRSVLDVWPESDRFHSRLLQKVAAGQAVRVRERAFSRPGASGRQTLLLDLDATPVVSEAGAVVAVLCIAHDVTDWDQCTRRLADSEQRLRHALEGSGLVGTWRLDLATRETVADASVARMYGLSAEQCEHGIPDAHFLQAVHPDDLPQVTAAFSEAERTGTPYRCRYRVVERGGTSARWVISSASPCRNAEGKVFQFLGVIVNVTEQMETVSALAKSRFHFRTLTEALPQIVWSCDGDGRHDYFSVRWSEFTGVDLKDVNEDTWKTLVYPEHWERVQTAWGNALRTGSSYDIDYRFRHRSGEYRWLRVMALPIRDEEGRIVRWFGTSTDVHEAYQIAEERERFARELERIAAEDQLTGVLTRRAFLARAAAWVDAQRPAQAGASLLMLDVDHFKNINDLHGHSAGDRALTALAHTIKASVRPQDLTGRMGGEEFAIFLPGCGETDAVHLAESICRSLAGCRVEVDAGITIAVTASIGATTASVEPGILETMLSTADKALYVAKSRGRNQTFFSAAPAPSTPSTPSASSVPRR